MVSRECVWSVGTVCRDCVCVVSRDCVWSVETVCGQ